VYFVNVIIIFILSYQVSEANWRLGNKDDGRESEEQAERMIAGRTDRKYG
jgi:hypothetical protein